MEIWNHILDKRTLLFPLENVGATISDHSSLLSSHVWGSPTSVIDPKLKYVNKLIKCQHRKRRGKLLGWIKVYNSTVGFITIYTGDIIPQLHTVTDDWFTTIL